MAEVQPFRGFRYDLARVGDLSSVIAPPYDVIDAPLQQELYRRSPYNVVRLILNKENPTDSEYDNRYTRSAQTLRDWLREGILAQDSARSLYRYQQEFEVEGKRYTPRASWHKCARKIWQWPNLSARGNAGGAQGGSPQTLQRHRDEPEPNFRPLSR